MIGKREDLIRLPLGHRERAAAVTQMRRRRLQVDRDRIVDRGLDALVGQIFLEVVAAVGLHDEGVEGVELDVAAGRNEQGSPASSARYCAALRRRRSITEGR